MKNTDFEPKLITVLKEGYSVELFTKDLLAGIIVGIVALPLSIAFAIASGVTPVQGLITAVIAGFLISAFGGSRVQIGGPTGAFIVIVFGIVQKYGYEGLALATIMAGVLLILLGVSRLGDMIKFIPYPVTVGFTGGIALIIFTTQIKDFFGLSIASLPDHFLPKWLVYIQNLYTYNSWSLILGVITIAIIVLWPKVTRRFPGPLIAVVLTTILVHVFGLSVDTIGSRFGAVSNSIPHPSIPKINWEILVKLSSPALTIALLGGIESLLSAVVADGMTGRKHRSNMELIAQGMANIVCPIFSGIPATGAIARTATNIKNGGKTPFAGIIHAVVVLLCLLFFGKYVVLIPMATLAGILIVVAYNMCEWHLFIKMLKTRKGDVLVLLVTFFLTVFVDLTVAIEVGVVLASFLFMHRVVAVSEVDYITENFDEDPNSMLRQEVPPGVEIFEISGPFFFGAADKFRDMLREIQRKPKVLLLGLRHVPTIDATGLRALEDLFENAQRDKTKVIIYGASPRLVELLNKMEFIDKIGHENICSNLDKAIEAARGLVGKG
ncbi:MAG: sulfate permease [Candidatus Omnitrophota bacterium]